MADKHHFRIIFYFHEKMPTPHDFQEEFTVEMSDVLGAKDQAKNIAKGKLMAMMASSRRPVRWQFQQLINIPLGVNMECTAK